MGCQGGQGARAAGGARPAGQRLASSLRAISGGAEGSRRVSWVSCRLGLSLGVCGGQKMSAELLTLLEGSKGGKEQRVTGR